MYNTQNFECGSIRFSLEPIGIRWTGAKGKDKKKEKREYKRTNKDEQQPSKNIKDRQNKKMSLKYIYLNLPGVWDCVACHHHQC